MTDAPRIPTQFIAPVDMPTVQRADDDPPPVDMPTVQRPEGTPPPVDMPQHDRAPERDAEAVEATPAAAAPPSGPTPLAAGTYAVYDDQAGGYVLVIGTREGETHHKHLPKNIVKMAEKMAGGANPLAMLFGGA